MVNKKNQQVIEYKIIIYFALGISIFLGIIFFHDVFTSKQEKQYPNAAKVVSFYTEKAKRGGVNYQRIMFNNKKRMTANGFSSIINGRKIMLINYINIGDSIVRDSFPVALVYRNGSDTFKFTFNSEDFK